MPGQQAYIHQANNLLANAAITFAVSPSAKTPLVYPQVKQGNGNLRVQGAYEGSLDALFDIIIADTAFTAPIVSSPIFRGAGTGTIKNIAASGLEAQKITTLCLSTGVSTQYAEAEIEGVLFRAKTAGAAGNAITIAIDDSSLVFTATDYSTLKELKEGDTALPGQEWDWDTKTILGDIVPSTAHRVAFGTDTLHIYRQYKKWEDGKYVYYFIQPIKQEVKAGLKVYFVTGGRGVTITDGVTTEVYTNIVTIADLWAAVRALPSALIEAVDTIDTSMHYSSPGVRELAVMTEAYALPAYRSDDSSAYAGELSGITVNDNTKTELIEIKCVKNDVIGREEWEVKGSSSGDLGEARTGDMNQFGPVGFTIPQKFPPDFGNLKEDWSFETNYATRDEGVTPPPICFAMQLGINSREQTLTLTYREKPTACSCPPVDFNETYLGLAEEGGEIGMAYIVPDLTFWTIGVQDRMRELSQPIENYEGREAASVANGLGQFTKATEEYFARFKVLAERIKALPEEDAGVSALTGMVSAFKDLVNSLTITSLNGVHIMSWDGDDWDTTFAFMDVFSVAQIQDVSYDTDGYKDLVDNILTYETTYGLKKNSLIPGDVPYTDVNADYYWEVKGDKPYLPAFTDYAYYSVIRQGGDTYVNTKEFAFHISVPCGGTLLEGDQIIVSINGIQYARTYQIGDVIYLPTVAAADLSLAGGIDGDDTYVFGVSGSVAGAFANYLLDRDAPLPYYGTLAAAWQAGHFYSLTNYVKAVTFNNRRYECTVAGTSGGTQPTWPTPIGATVVDGGATWTCRAVELQLEIEDGIISFAVGDSFEFNIEGGHFKWRKDGGAWSSLIAMSTAFQEITEGVEVAFDFGVSPSFVVDDAWEIICLQENKAANMVTPRKQKAKGTGTITFAFAAPVTIDCLIIDRHTLPATVTFQASDVSNFGTLLHAETITTGTFVCKLYTGVNVITAKYFRIVPGAVEVELGHVFLGTMMQLSLSADSIKPTKRFYMSRQSGEESLGLMKYKKRGYDVNYKSFIRNADWVKLDAIIEYLKTNNDLPFYFIANTAYPTDCLREASIYMDSVTPESPVDQNAPEGDRLYAISFNVVGT